MCERGTDAQVKVVVNDKTVLACINLHTSLVHYSIDILRPVGLT